MTTKQRKEYLRYMENLSYEDSIATTKNIEQEAREKKLRKESEEKGIEKGIYETAKNGIIAGFSNEIIKAMTKLTDEQIDKIRNELKNNDNQSA